MLAVHHLANGHKLATGHKLETANNLATSHDKESTNLVTMLVAHKTWQPVTSL